jgi:nucleoside-diphosphate-sugar epimerase
MKKVVITGGAGFIGKELTKSLLRYNYKLFILDNLSFKQDFIKSKSIKNYKIDITEKIKLINLINKIEPNIVVHLAAVHSIPVCEKKRQLAQLTNIVGTENLLEAIGNIKLDKFIHASTGGIYSWKSRILDEKKSSLDPRDNYSVTKFSNEKQIYFWSEKTSNKYVIARIFNAIGPNDPNGHLIPDILSQINKDKKVNKIFLGNIFAKRDYIDVRDVAKSLTKIIRLRLSKKSEIINICNQSNYSIKDILKIISYELGTIIKVKIDKKRLRKFDRPHQTGSNKKLIKLVGYKPLYKLKHSIINIIKK